MFGKYFNIVNTMVNTVINATDWALKSLSAK